MVEHLRHARVKPVEQAHLGIDHEFQHQLLELGGTDLPPRQFLQPRLALGHDDVGIVLDKFG